MIILNDKFYQYNSLLQNFIIVMLTSMNSSIHKPRRGLSLSLENKKRQTQCKPIKIEFKQIIKQTINNSSSAHSAKKNKIKYVQGYKNKQNQSKLEQKDKYLKIQDHDIKLGGKKNTYRSIIRNQHFNATINNFRNYKLQSTQLVHFDRHSFQSDRKYMRESKVQNLNSNINYFQNINIRPQNINIKQENINIYQQNINIKQENKQSKLPFHSTMLLRSSVRFPLDEIEQFHSENLLKSQRLIQNLLPANAQEISKQSSVVMKQSKKLVQLKSQKSGQIQCQLDEQRNCEALKTKAFIKLQQIQTQINCLLFKASQAKSLIQIN